MTVTRGVSHTPQTLTHCDDDDAGGGGGGHDRHGDDSGDDDDVDEDDNDGDGDEHTRRLTLSPFNLLAIISTSVTTREAQLEWQHYHQDHDREHRQDGD